jgi:PST family polysaccharide transporter
LDELSDPTGVVTRAAQVAAPPPPPRSQALGERAAMGFFYAMVTFGAGKAIALAGQLALSWILGNADFGYIGLTLLVGAFGALIGQAGVREVLIRRWKNFDHWATPAFWLCVTLGTLSMLLTMAAAPLAAWFFHDRRLVPLIVVLATQNLVNALGIVPEARLTADLRFKRLNAIHLACNTLVVVLSVTFALLGFGPYSFIVPWPIMSTLRTIMMWHGSGQRVQRRLHVEMWRAMAGDNVLLFIAAACQMLIGQGDYIILGRMYTDKAVIGNYFWAFCLSGQALQLLALNLGGVLHPSLAKLQDEPGRQLSAFLRAAKALTVLVVPTCLLQATLADPAIRLLLPAKWYPAIPIVAVLSAGWVFMGANLPAINLLKAQGRFRTVMWYFIFSAISFLLLVYIGARSGGGLGAGVAVALFSALAGPISVYLGVRPLEGTASDTWGVFLAPLVSGVVAFTAGGALAWMIPPGPLQHLLRSAVICTVSTALYVVILRQIARSASEEIMLHVRGLLHRAGLGREEPAEPVSAMTSGGSGGGGGGGGG